MAVLTNASVLIYTLQAIKGCGRPSRLTLARYQSGETDIEGRVSRCGEERARTALYEAAHTLLVHTRSGRAWSMKIAKLRGMARPRSGRPQARRDPASRVERRNRAPLRQVSLAEA